MSITRRTRIPLWQSMVISVVTAGAAVSIYDAVFVEEPPPPLAPVVIAMPAPAPLACPPPPPPRVIVAPERGEEPSGGSERADQLFRDAIDLLRDKQQYEGCAMLERVAFMRDGGHSVEKARSLLERRCE